MPMTARSDILRPWRVVLAVALAAALAVAGRVAGAAADAADAPESAENACVRSIAHSERAEDIPSHLLAAISLAESGRWDARNQAIVAWPWTVTAEGQGLFFDTKEAAVAMVRTLRARGVSSIDVGCLQVNLHFHPHAFQTLESAFDPARNVAYAARFLKSLRDEKRSWSRAVAHYHSATRDYNEPYRKKVFKLWNQARRRAAEARRQAVIEAYRERRAAREAQRAARERAKASS
jgi:hypothetical protein